MPSTATKTTVPPSAAIASASAVSAARLDAPLLEQAAAPDEHLGAVDRAAHATADDRLEPVDLREPELRLARPADDRLAQRVLRAGLEGRGEVQDPRLVEAGRG